VGKWAGRPGPRDPPPGVGKKKPGSDGILVRRGQKIA
jgi:hypothetical protein